MAVSWTGGASNYTSGTQTSGNIDTLAPIPSDRYVLLRGMGWNGSSATARAIFGDVWGYAERTSETTATVYLCQRGWIYHKRAANYAACMALDTNVYSTGTSSGYMWGYNSYAASFTATGSTTTSSLGTFRYSSAASTYTPYGGQLRLVNTGRSWWRQISTITDVPVDNTTSKITLNFGALSGTGAASEYYWEGGSAAWTAELPIYPHSIFVNVGGTWKSGLAWVNVNGTWKQGIPWVNVNGTWKRI